MRLVSHSLKPALYSLSNRCSSLAVSAACLNERPYKISESLSTLILRCASKSIFHISHIAGTPAPEFSGKSMTEPRVHDRRAAKIANGCQTSDRLTDCGKRQLSVGLPGNWTAHIHHDLIILANFISSGADANESYRI